MAGLLTFISTALSQLCDLAERAQPTPSTDPLREVAGELVEVLRLSLKPYARMADSEVRELSHQEAKWVLASRSALTKAKEAGL